MATIDLGKIKQVFRGTYNNATAYVPDDLVVFTDTNITSTYICTTASTGNNPSSGGTAHANWAYIAKGVVDPIPSQSGNSGKFLKTNGSALSFDTVSAGITDADQWRVTSNFNGSSGGGDISANWERNDTTFDKIGNGMTESSGVFTFPSTGIWRITTCFNANGTNLQYVGYTIQATTNNSSFSEIAENYDFTNKHLTPILKLHYRIYPDCRRRIRWEYKNDLVALEELDTIDEQIKKREESRFNNS